MTAKTLYERSLSLLKDVSQYRTMQPKDKEIILNYLVKVSDRLFDYFLKELKEDFSDENNRGLDE